MYSQVWKCRENPIHYCMRTSNFDKHYTSGAVKYVFYTNNPMLWRKDGKKSFAALRKVGCKGQLKCLHDIESVIQASPTWLDYPGYVIARGVGIFQHGRVDRGRAVPGQ